jgi:integrase
MTVTPVKQLASYLSSFTDPTVSATDHGSASTALEYQARIGDPQLANADISPHTLRHSKAMHLYEAGIPLPYIRDILGHVDLSTTEIYARASTEAKRKALEAAYTDIVTDDLPEWNQDPGLLDWLTNL